MQPPCGVAEGTSDARVSDLKEALGAERQSTESGLSAECQKTEKVALCRPWSGSPQNCGSCLHAVEF